MSGYLYPVGYGQRYVTLGELRAIHEPYMHPEFGRRLFGWLESMRGAVGIGGGYRPPGTQPDAPGFAPPGKSFHEGQRWASGIIAYAAVDLVAPDGPDANLSHDGVTPALTATAALYGLHTNVPGEPWHLQPVEVDGWGTWDHAGRPDPQYRQLPGDLDPDQPTDPEDDDMSTFPIRAIYTPSQAAAVGNRRKTFGLLATGDVRHLTGPDVAAARAAGAPEYPIAGTEHYDQLDALDAVYRSA